MLVFLPILNFGLRPNDKREVKNPWDKYETNLTVGNSKRPPKNDHQRDRCVKKKAAGINLEICEQSVNIQYNSHPSFPLTGQWSPHVAFRKLGEERATYSQGNTLK